MSSIAIAVFLGISPETLAIIVIGGMLLFGANKIPELFRNMGQGVKEFKKGLNTDEDDDDDQKKEGKKKAAKDEDSE